MRVHLWQPVQARCGWVQPDGTLKACPAPLDGLFEFFAAADAAPNTVGSALGQWHAAWHAPFPPPDDFWRRAAVTPPGAEVRASLETFTQYDHPAVEVFDFIIGPARQSTRQSRRPVAGPPPRTPVGLPETIHDLLVCTWTCLAVDPTRPMTGLPFTKSLADFTIAALRERGEVVPFEFARMSPAGRLGTLGAPWSMRHHTAQVRPVLSVAPDVDVDLRALRRRADSALPETLAPFWSPVETLETQNIYAVVWLDFWMALTSGLRLCSCASCGQVFLGTGSRHVYCTAHASTGALEPDAHNESGQTDWRIRRAYERARQRANGEPFPDFATWAQGYPHRAGRRKTGK